MKLKMATDGACRRNGKPDCISAGGVFVCNQTSDGTDTSIYTLSEYEVNSTNQRGEMLGLALALEHAVSVKPTEVQIITDSAFLRNAIVNEWYKRWSINGWLKADLEPVKNADLWRRLCKSLDTLEELDIEIMIYHVKGHVIPVGKVTAQNILLKDLSGATLYRHVLDKYDSVKYQYQNKIDHAQQTSIKTNGFELAEVLLRDFICMNLVVDFVANQCIEKADNLLQSS